MERALLLGLCQIGSDFARALVVLSMVFLSFAHAPLASAHPVGNVLTTAVDASWCGDAPGGDGKAHAPCHACRLGAGADLPPPAPPVLAPVEVTEVHYGALPVLCLPSEPLGSATARGPPAA